jgi:eukaryotic-like serine/threonine-protein kinase
MTAVVKPDPARLKRVNALLEAALALPESERERWLKTLPPEQQALAPTLRAMLARASAQTDSFLRRPLGVSLDQIDDLELAADRAGDHVGPYRLVHEIGAGGMATVWLAERDDGVLHRQVALKLPRTGWALGLAQRMAREREILASLEHPRIARLYDAGVTPAGRPWMAMEYVAGLPIDRYCDEEQLGVRQRLRLFLQVTDAVAHAHARLVVHRDLKPSNILVTPEGEVRLLDFGVAKLLEDDAPAASHLTQLMGHAITPDYASPEQVAGQRVTVATDVYSLGVVLYELLTGQRPYRLGRSSTAALEEAILAADVPLASTRVARERRLARQLRGDLDTVLAKALRKDPAKRYTSVEAFAADLWRHIDGEAVLAQPHSTAYRLHKFVRRHRLQVGAGLVVGVAVLAGAGVALWQARLASQQAAAAERQAQRAQAVQGVLMNIFKANSTQQADPLRARQTTARELLDIGARQAAAGLEGSPEAQDQVLDTLADMYFQLELGEDAARMRRQRVEALRKAYGNADARVADALIAYAHDVATTQDPNRAVAALAEATQILDNAKDFTSETRGWIALESANIQRYQSIPAMRRHAEAALLHFRTYPSQWTSRFHALQAVARARFLSGDYAAAAAGHQDALAHAEREANGPTAWSITPLVQLAEAQTALLQFDAAERNLRAALALAQRLSGESSGVALQTQAKLAGLLHGGGQRDEAGRLLAHAQAAIANNQPNAMPDAVGTVKRFAGWVAQGEGRIAQSEGFLADEEADLRRQLPASLPLSRVLLLHAAPLAAMGRYEAAAQALDEAWRLWQAVSGEGVDPAASNRYRLERARLALARGDASAAEAALAQVVPPANAAQLPLQLDQAYADVLLAQARLQQQRPADAIALAQRVLTAMRASPVRARFARLEAEASLRLGQALLRSGDARAARAALEQAVALRQASEAPSSPWLADAQVALAESLQKLGDAKAARVLIDKAQAIHAANVELGLHFKAPLARLAAQLAQR